MWITERKTVNPYQVRYSNILRNIDTTPYLTWVPESLRSRTIDPTTLPRSPYRRRRVLMMSSSYLTGGAEMFAVNAARILAPRHDVFLWSQRPGPYSIQGDLPIYEGNPVSIAKDLGIDLVIYNNGAAFWNEPRFKAETSIPTVLCLHGLVKWTVDQFLGHEASLGTIDAMWAFSRVCGAMKSIGFKAPAYELHCPVEASRFPFQERVWNPPFNIGYVGRVSVEKNLPNLVRLWHRLWKVMGRRVRFHFVGGLDPTNHDKDYLNWLGPVVSNAKAMTEWNELLDAGILTDYGHCHPDKVAEVVRNLHVLTLTSDFEGEPVVFTEAMASGALCSFRDVGEVGEQLRGGGLLTTARTRKMDARELDEMAAGIIATLGRPRLCRDMAHKARERYEARHAPESWAANFERMMEDILR